MQHALSERKNAPLKAKFDMITNEHLQVFRGYDEDDVALIAGARMQRREGRPASSLISPDCATAPSICGSLPANLMVR
jgi:hypothetical protein